MSLEAIVERARSLLEWKSGAKRMVIEVAIEEDLPPLAADPDQLQQVFVNLLLNACDASHEGDRILVRACHDHGATGADRGRATAAAASRPST